MKQSATRIRNVHAILASSAGLVLLVATAVSWLGWRLLSQEETLVRQQTRNRLEQTADVLLAGFLRKTTEMESWLGRIGSKLPAEADAPAETAGAVLITLSQSSVEVRPSGQLLYYPSPPLSPGFDTQTFAESDKAEFQTGDLKAASAALAVLIASKDPRIRAEALLRLARVESKSGRIAEALATYGKLADERLMSPLEAPYGLLSRFARCQLLAGSHQESAAQQEATALLATLESGQWPLSKGSYVEYHTETQKLAGLRSESPSLNEKLAVAETVESLWDEWQLFQRSGPHSLTKHLHSYGRVPVVAILNATPERLAALIYPGDSLRRLGLDPAEDSEAPDIQVSLTDEHARLIFGAMPETTQAQATRTLSAAELPWHFNVTLSSSDVSGSLLAERRKFYILALAGVVLLVSLACYAMVRGVLREAAAGRLQSDFVSAVSHEFRSPLTTLRQLTELLAEGRINDESRRRLYFGVLQKESFRLYQLVEDLLDFGRMDAGRRQYRFEPLDLSELVRDGIHEYEVQSNGNRHAIHLNSSNGDLVVNGDREALRLVVRNLLENAVKYSPNAQAVWVETSSEAHAAVLRVRDEGMGIPPEERSRVFEKFVRGEAAKQACIQGTGIGLAMVKEVMRVHRGEVDLITEVGRGSTFIIRLPLVTNGDGHRSTQ